MRTVLAVRPVDSWRELWLFHQTRDRGRGDIAPPADGKTELGHIQFTGWVPGANKLLAAREATINGRFERGFEVLNMQTLQVEKIRRQCSLIELVLSLAGSAVETADLESPLMRGGCCSDR